MRDYGKVHSSFWTSETTRSMSEDARNLSLYLLTCPHNTIAGVFRLPDGYVCDDMQWTSERVEKAFNETLSKGFAIRCETTKWVWINKHFEWNPPENPNQRKCAAKIVVSIPDTCCWKLVFMRDCSEFVGVKQEPLPNPSTTLSKPEAVTEAVTETEEKTKRAPRFDPQKYLVELGVSPDLATDWIEHRKSVKAKPSKTAIDGIAKEAEKAQMSLSDALRESCSRGWRGFKAEWMENKTKNARASPSGQSWQDRQAETIAILTGRSKPNEPERDITGEARRVA